VDLVAGGGFRRVIAEDRLADELVDIELRHRIPPWTRTLAKVEVTRSAAILAAGPTASCRRTWITAAGSRRAERRHPAGWNGGILPPGPWGGKRPPDWSLGVTRMYLEHSA